MPPRVPLPRLTLFTGGKECSLCEVAKEELATLRKSTAFELVYWNIRDPPAGADEWEAKKWRRLYQYDIVGIFQTSKTMVMLTKPAGVASRRQKSAETSYKSTRVAKGARGMASQSSDVERDPESAVKAFKPYSSILKFTSAPAWLQPDIDEEKKKEAPPWRRAVGRVHFSTDYMEDEGGGSEEIVGYSEILERTFARFSDEIIGNNIPVIDFRALDDEADWGIDEQPGPQVAGEKGVLYDVADEVAQTTPIKNNRTCWNCGSAHHELVDCPQPRDQGQIALSRATFEAQKGLMPDYAIPFLKMYTFDAEEKARRLALVEKFIPGQVSRNLLNAVFWVDEDMSVDEKQQMEGWRKRRYYPWYQWMLKWGYPPGWVAGRDPIQHLRDQLEKMPIEDDGNDFDDGDNVLQVFGGDVDDGISRAIPLPASPTSSDMSLESASEEESESAIEPAGPAGSSPKASPPPPPPSDTPPSLALRPPAPPMSPPPPPPPDELPPPPPAPHQTPIDAPIRWARYDTDLFDSDRLMAFTTARPLPLGF